MLSSPSLYMQAAVDARRRRCRCQGSASDLTHELDAKFTALVERQARFVFRVAYAVLQNAHDAEDAVQETFLKLYRNKGWHAMDDERAFLARVVWRVAVDLRARRCPQGKSVDEGGGGEDTQLSAGDSSPEQAVLEQDRHTRVHALIDALPEDLRLPLVLSSFDELNSRQIGELLSLPEGTVRTRLMRARQLLREKLTTREVVRRD